jgi:RNA-directed DNA polymerase
MSADWYDKVLGNDGAAGIDRISCGRYAANREHFNAHLVSALRDGSYRADEVRRKDIPKAGSKETRPLGIPTVRDRIVQAALCAVLEPIFDLEFSERSYGFRRGRGCKDALREVDRLLKAGNGFVVDADIKGYFNTIPHGKLLKLVGKRIADGKVLALIKQFLEKGVLEELENRKELCGTPQGGVISPLLANIYLDPLDHLLEAEGFQCIRYADDFVILCASREEAERGLAKVQEWMAEAELTLHPTKTKIADLNQLGGYFEFLGYRFQRCKTRIQRWPRSKSMDKVKESIRDITKRCNGIGMKEIIAKLTPRLKGWYGYFKHSSKNTFNWLDGYMRRRMRSILRKRSKRRGVSRGNGADQTRWPNAFFRDLGYWSLADAYRSELQSLRGPVERRAVCGKSARTVRREGG